MLKQNLNNKADHFYSGTCWHRQEISSSDETADWDDSNVHLMAKWDYERGSNRN